MKPKYILPELLSGITPENVHETVDFGADVGQERAPQPFMDGPFLVSALAGLIREDKLDLTGADVEDIAEVFNRLQIALHRHFSRPGPAAGQITDDFSHTKPLV
jgi:hypothetical protein